MLDSEMQDLGAALIAWVSAVITDPCVAQQSFSDWCAQYQQESLGQGFSSTSPVKAGM